MNRQQQFEINFRIKKVIYANLNNKQNSISHILLKISLHEAFHNKNQQNLY